MVTGFKGRHSQHMLTWSGDSVASMTESNLADLKIKSRVIFINDVRSFPDSWPLTVCLRSGARKCPAVVTSQCSLER